MPKKRKTKKAKIQHDHKAQTVHESALPVTTSPKNETLEKQESIPTGMTFSLPTSQNKSSETIKAKQSSLTVAVAHGEYGYLSNDLMRTALLTGAIVFTELVIKLFIVH